MPFSLNRQWKHNVEVNNRANQDTYLWLYVRGVAEQKISISLAFLFNLIGGSAVEAKRDDVKFTAPLTGITVAVVGVVLNLAVFFAYHVLWPGGFEAGFEWFAAMIGAVAFLALFRFKVAIVLVIAGCAVIGLTYSLLLKKGH